MLVMTQVDLMVGHIEEGLDPDLSNGIWALKRGAIGEVHEIDGKVWTTWWLYNQDNELVNKTVYSGETLIRVPIEFLAEVELVKVEVMLAFPVDDDKARKVASRAEKFRFEAGNLALGGDGVYRADMSISRKRGGGCWVKSNS